MVRDGAHQAGDDNDVASDARWGALADQIERTLGIAVAVDEPLGAKTTYRVGGSARLFVELTTVQQVEGIVELAVDAGVELLVIGRGSNSLIGDEGFDGIAVSIAGLADEITIDAATSQVTVGGGIDLPRVARQTAAAGLTGFEWAVGVPGSIGGAVRMNAGGHGSDMAACVLDVEVVTIGPHPRVTRLTAGQLGFRFRGSDLADSAIVLRARLQLEPGDAERAKQTIAEIVRWRREHQPGGQNCGSVFVNPVPGVAASGGLIDELGLRGLRHGSAAVSAKHANFIQSDSGGVAADVARVIDDVRQRVAAGAGIVLRSEVRMIGFGQVTSW